MMDGREEDRVAAVAFAGFALFCSIAALLLSIVALFIAMQ